MRFNLLFTKKNGPSGPFLIDDEPHFVAERPDIAR